MYLYLFNFNYYSPNFITHFLATASSATLNTVFNAIHSLETPRLISILRFLQDYDPPACFSTLTKFLFRLLPLNSCHSTTSWLSCIFNLQQLKIIIISNVRRLPVDFYDLLKSNDQVNEKKNKKRRRNGIQLKLKSMA